MKFNILIKQHWSTFLVFRNAASFLILLSILILIGCKKFVNVETPPDRVSQKNVYTNDQTAITAMNGLYISISSFGSDITKYGGLLADEFNLWSGADLSHFAYYTNNLISNATLTYGNQIWTQSFNYIFNCNSAIEGLSTSKDLSPTIKKQLLGEAYFLRAWFYFYLVNYYGDLPLIISTDPEQNRLLPRSSTQTVYDLIKRDLLKSKELLAAEYLNGQLIPYTTSSVERVRPTRWAAIALLARVYLYTEEWTNAEMESTTVLNNVTQFGLVSNLDGVFLKNSREAIWQLQPTTAGYNTWEGATFNLISDPVGLNSSKPVYLSDFLITSFENKDNRKEHWIGSLITGGLTYYFPTKYKSGAQNSNITSPAQMTEYSMVLRLAEQYLNRAEARLKNNNLTGSMSDLDVIRLRAGLNSIAESKPNISKEELLKLITHERQIELFTEWGTRWLDLKRSGDLLSTMRIVTPTKGGTWENTDQLLPLPYNDLLYSPNMSQNPGY